MSTMFFRSFSRTGVFLAVSVVLLAALAAITGCEKQPPAEPRSEDQLRNVLPPAVLDVLRSADKFELVSLDPTNMRPSGDSEPAPPNDFHGCDELGRTTLRQADRKTAIDTLVNSMAVWNGLASACILEPRHALVATRGSEVAEVLICFKCGDLMTIIGEDKQFFHLDGGQEVLDKMLLDAGIKLAPPPR